MDDRGTWATDEAGTPQWVSDQMEGFAKRSILLVEDEPDIRGLLVTFLGTAGFQTAACGTAEEALNLLRESSFDLVLTDYCLPRRTGGWLLKQASAEGLLEATPALVVTAHPNPVDTDGFEVISKPFDLDDLIEHVRVRLTADKDGNGKDGASRSSRRPCDQNGPPECPDPIELILYVGADAPRSADAIQNIKDVLSRFHSSRVSLTICDLSQEPAGGADTVAFTPALVKRSPGPRTFILGHLTNPAIALELLEGCEES